MRLSQLKKDKIAEQILSFLYHGFPKQPFTAEIARELARDEEFIKTLLHQLKEKELVIPINKNSSGVEYIKRTRWRLSNKAHEAYLKQPS